MRVRTLKECFSAEPSGGNVLAPARTLRSNENIEKFIQKAHKYVGIEELDPYALRELVKAIYVDAPVKVNGKRTQHIHIQYDGIGFIPLEELLKEETA